MDQEATSSSLAVPTDTEISEMDKLMSDGKRNYICNQPQLALKCFIELCEKIAKHYGQESGKCVEAYLYYGKTLLDIARMENGVLGPAIPETSEETEVDVDDETECTDVKDAAESTENGSLAEKADNVENQETKPNEVGEEVGEEVGDEEDAEEDEEVSNMELAWEMFELTSVICKRQLEEGQDKKSSKSNLAEAKYGLAQISLETERYEDAITDFKESLLIYDEILDDKSDRLLAEAHYNIALAYSFNKQYTEAITEFKDAVSILKANATVLETKIKESVEKAGKGKASAELEGWNKEIKELNEIISDMMAKIEDAHESKKLLDESIKTVKDAASAMFSSLSGPKSGFDNGFDNGFDDGFDSPLTDSTNTINDCSNKIRSMKRKNEEPSISCEKKIKPIPLDESKPIADNLSSSEN